MAVPEKTRPQNNFHCFDGAGLAYWREIASGFKPGEYRKGPDGYQLPLAADVDGLALQNGGMYSPQVTKMNPNTFFRFSGSITLNRYGPGAALTGGWWIDADTLQEIVSFASRLDIPLAQAARRTLIIPGEWQDCGYLTYALLKYPMKAFVGRGKPATAKTSPTLARQLGQNIPIMIEPAGMTIKQYFLPGTREELGRAFECLWTKQVTKTGVELNFGPLAPKRQGSRA